jgi:hypothetical protein
VLIIAKIIGVSLLAAGLAAGLGYAWFWQNSDWPGISFILGCVGGIIGSIAGAAREIATSQRARSDRRPGPAD